MPSSKIEFIPEAANESEAARDWYRQRSARAETEFLAEIEMAVEAVSRAPGRWPAYLLGTKRCIVWVLAGFKA